MRSQYHISGLCLLCALPLVVGEAACLKTPILSTQTSSAREMIEATGYGWVCENTEPAMQEALTHLLQNRSAIDERRKTLANMEIGNALAISQFAQLVGE